jgi:hypothetical protein
MEGVDEFAKEIATDIGRYKEVLEGMLGDVYSVRPELAPRLHDLITRCNGVIAMAKKCLQEPESSAETRRQIGAQVASIRVLTELFLEELTDSVSEDEGEDGPEEGQFKGAAAA